MTEILLRARGTSAAKIGDTVTFHDKSSKTLTVTNTLGSKSHLFSEIFDTESTLDIYIKSIKSSVAVCMEGFNTSIVVLGPSKSGKTTTVSGENGLVMLISQDLLSACNQFVNHIDDTRSDAAISIQVMEVFILDFIVDLWRNDSRFIRTC
jgi:septin family protein